MFTKMLSASNDWTGFILRLTLGLILLPHGAQKLLGWFGGFGFLGTMGYFTGTMHLPWIIGFLVIFIEVVGSLLLLVGLGTRFVAASVILLMGGIIISSHLENGFFMNWLGNQKGEGFEYHLLVIGLACAILTNGGGKYSLDRTITG